MYISDPQLKKKKKHDTSQWLNKRGMRKDWWSELLFFSLYIIFMLVLSTFSSPIHSSTHCNQDISHLSTPTALAKTNNDRIIADQSQHRVQ